MRERRGVGNPRTQPPPLVRLARQTLSEIFALVVFTQRESFFVFWLLDLVPMLKRQP